MTDLAPVPASRPVEAGGDTPNSILIAPDYGPDPATYHQEGKTVGVYGGKFFPPHRGHIGFALHAASMVDVLFVAVQYDEEYEKALCEGTSHIPATPQLRAAWLTEEFRNYPNIRVLAHYLKRGPDHLNYPELAVIHQQLTEAVGGHIDRVFSNTHEYDEYFTTWLPGVEHVVLEGRPIVNISATQIRAEGPEATWSYLPEAVQRYYQKRTVLAGWESTGKTYTARSVAKTLGGHYLPEYGREYFDLRGGYLSVEKPTDFLNIAAGHLNQLEQAPTHSPFLLVDTDLIYTQFYHLEVHGTLHPALDEIIKSGVENIHQYVFLEPRNQFHQDGSRMLFDQVERQAVSDRLKDLYRHYGKTLLVVDEPDPATRLQMTVQAVQAGLAATTIV